ncbi:MAG: hypothetical protein IJ180_05570 [Bacteroidales bacterium]|nr:hypothetical protein [Bacteroidales bacterium]
MYPRILIIGRVAWTKDESTLSGIFKGYPSDRLAYVCIETREPDLSHCKQHFQISETAMIRRFWNWKVKTGSKIVESSGAINKKNERQERQMLSTVRSHRSIWLLFLRELLWCVGYWKSKELKQFVMDFAPDVVFCVGDPLPLMNRLQCFIATSAKKPATMFFMDDIWTYKSCHGTLQHIYRHLLRRQVKPLVQICQAHFAISPKMMREYDKQFGIKCSLLTKGIETNQNVLRRGAVHSPIAMVYTGNLLYGRLKTLTIMASAIRQMNEGVGSTQAILHIYTQTQLSEQDVIELEQGGASILHKSVPYAQLQQVYNQSDVVLFVESLEERYRHIAWLSFSTKLTDYMGSGKCIFAIGDAETAPIEYLRETDIAIVCTSYDEIPQQLTEIIGHNDLIHEKAKMAFDYGQQYHSIEVMSQRLKTVLTDIIHKEA